MIHACQVHVSIFLSGPAPETDENNSSVIRYDKEYQNSDN